MKIERIERKEKDSVVLQYLVVVLVLLEVNLALYMLYNLVVAPENTKLIGTLFAAALIMLAAIFWALEKGYLADERVYALE